MPATVRYFLATLYVRILIQTSHNILLAKALSKRTVVGVVQVPLWQWVITLLLMVSYTLHLQCSSSSSQWKCDLCYITFR